jgi:probable F420-dependent oxidoreductase
MKIRFGISLGASTAPDQLAGIVDHLEASGVDSLWFSELVYSPAVDPIVGMAYALARTTRLKVGTSVAVLPGRHPVLVAKQLASLAAVAPKRVLPVFGLRSAIPAEREIFVVPDGERAAVFDESLRVLRSALVDDSASYFGRYFGQRRGDHAAADASAGHLAGRLSAGGVSADRHAGRWLAG